MILWFHELISLVSTASIFRCHFPPNPHRFPIRMMHLSTQATLIAWPLAAEKEPPAPDHTPTKAVEARISTLKSSVPPNSEQMV
jgi:hypothetical protein